MRRTELTLKTICREVAAILRTKFNEGWAKRKGPLLHTCQVCSAYRQLQNTLNPVI